MFISLLICMGVSLITIKRLTSDCLMQKVLLSTNKSQG